MAVERTELQALVDSAKRVAAFTGAGISAESGIPTYRGDDGVWNKYDPAKYAEIGNFLADPAYYWSFFREVRYPVLRNARPNPAHLALARLEQQGKLSAVITQNIDGLHQEAGSEKVLELHGNTRRISCLGCGKGYSLDQVHHRLEEKFPPDCPACGGVLKPEVVFFGESLPMEVLDDAVEETRSCDLFLVVGSSLVVQPAASLPPLAVESGARLVIINRDPTPLDRLAHLVLHEKASDVLGPLIGLPD
jgi:NAD-dependent deacetylase